MYRNLRDIRSHIAAVIELPCASPCCTPCCTLAPIQLPSIRSYSSGGNRLLQLPEEQHKLEEQQIKLREEQQKLEDKQHRLHEEKLLQARSEATAKGYGTVECRDCVNDSVMRMRISPHFGLGWLHRDIRKRGYFARVFHNGFAVVTFSHF